MLNQTGVIKESYGIRKTILFDELNSTAISCIVANTGVTAGSDGKKIIKAGTPLKGDLTNRETPFTVASDTASGVILHDVDVTEGNANSQIVIFGTIDISKLEEDVVTKITEGIKSSLKMIQFIK